jgi:PE family/PPE-SVP subfamily C-terminal region
MSLLTTVPEELAAAAAQLSAIVSSLTAQNAGAAAATTGVAPAAADSVSLQQAGIFSAYGTLYQQIASEAQAIQQQFASTLGLSSGTYAATEASNASQAGSPTDILNSLFGFLSGTNALSPSGGASTIGLVQAGNFASAQSDDLGLITGTLSAVTAPSDAAGDLSGLAGAADLAGTTGPAIGPGMGGMAGMAGMGAMPMTAGMGGATMVGKLSVPPSWAGTVTTVSSTTPMGLQTAGWTAAAPQAGPGTIIPGMPGVGAAARNSAGFGAPRYGVKPLVMPKPAVV